jgi:hypothetical protein
VTSPSSIQIDNWPESVQEFLALRDRVARTPQGGAAMMVVALFTYTQDEDLGRQCLPIAVDRGSLTEGAAGYKGWQLRTRDIRQIGQQIAQQPYIAQSYVGGVRPETGYQLPAPPYTFEFEDNPHSGDPQEGTYKAFIRCAGADSPRPVTVRRNNRGIWKAREWSSVIVGIMEPSTMVEDDL